MDFLGGVGFMFLVKTDSKSHELKTIMECFFHYLRAPPTRGDPRFVSFNFFFQIKKIA